MIFKHVRRREHKVYLLFNEHLNTVGECLAKFKEMTINYLNNNPLHEENALDVHKLESKADTIRRNIEKEIHGGAFLPFLREDYIEIAERIDKIADKAEAVVDFYMLVRPQIPDSLHDAIKELTDRTIVGLPHLKNMFDLLDVDMTKVVDEAVKVNIIESEVDQLERELIKNVFNLDIDLALKIILRELIRNIADISDLIQNASDRIEILTVKYRV